MLDVLLQMAGVVGLRYAGNVPESGKCNLRTGMMDDHDLGDTNANVDGEDVVQLWLRMAGDVADDECF